MTHSEASGELIAISADNKAFEDERGACVSFTWVGELGLFVIHCVHAELPVATLVESSMFGVVNVKLDCLDTDWLGVGGRRSIPQRRT